MYRPPLQAPEGRGWTRLAPAGAVVGVAPFVQGCKSWIFPGAGADAALGFFADYVGARHALGTSSGRTALCVILKGLQALRPDRRIVALPAYTCFSAAAAIVRADLKIHPVEIDPQTLDFDYVQLAKLPSSGLLCILTSNLFGFVNDVPRVREIARDKGAFVVDDAAQSLGASRDGDLSGTRSDVGFFSLGRGKPLPAGEGGVIVTDSDEIAEAVREQIARIDVSAWKDNAALFFKVLATSVFINRHLYWIPDSLPFLKLGVTPFEPSFPMKGLAPLSLGILRDLLGQLAELNEGRRRRAAWIAHALADNGNFTVPTVPPRCNPTFLRLPLLARSPELRDLAVQILRRAGIGATSLYPSAICDIPGIGKFMADGECHRPLAESLAARLLTLPTHAMVQREDARKMAYLLAPLAAPSA